MSILAALPRAQPSIAPGSQVVYSGGVASNTIVSSGGTEVSRPDGALVGVTIRSGGTLDLSLIVSSGATVSVPPLGAGVVISTTVFEGATISAGGALDVQSATVLSGGTLKVPAGALVIHTA